jgi:hypothetical protein
VPFSLLPREESFFDLFIEVARRSHSAAEHLAGLFAEPERAAYHAEQIKRLEHECDHLTHEVVNRLDRTFITPIDREDIYRLASDLDDVIDVIDGVARRTQLFKVGPAPEAAKRLTAVIQNVVGALLKGVEHLKNREGVMEASIQVKHFEEEADSIYHAAIGHLFETEQDARELIKWKEIYDNLEKPKGLDERIIAVNSLENDGDRIEREAIASLFEGDTKCTDIIKWKDIYETLEGAIDDCEHVANVIESIVLKHN